MVSGSRLEEEETPSDTTVRYSHARAENGHVIWHLRGLLFPQLGQFPQGGGPEAREEHTLIVKYAFKSLCKQGRREDGEKLERIKENFYF